MNKSDITCLAQDSIIMRDTGDEYADKRRSWVYDPANSGQPMWWGKDQPYYKFLYLVSKHFHGGMGIEIGTHRGIGFACMAAGATASGNPKSWTVGVDKDSHSEAIEVTTKYPRCEFINGLSNAPATIGRIEQICRENNIKITHMYIDATHKLSWVFEELLSHRHLFDNEVILIFDDIIHADNNTDLPKAFDEIPGQKIKFPNLHTDNCIAVSISSFAEFRHWVPITPITDLGY